MQSERDRKETCLELFETMLELESQNNQLKFNVMQDLKKTLKQGVHIETDISMLKQEYVSAHRSHGHILRNTKIDRSDNPAWMKSVAVLRHPKLTSRLAMYHGWSYMISKRYRNHSRMQ